MVVISKKTAIDGKASQEYVRVFGGKQLRGGKLNNSRIYNIFIRW